MVYEGIKLLTIGMGVVFIFLAILYVLTVVISAVLKGVTEGELADQNRQSKRTQSQPNGSASNVLPTDVHNRLIAIISAAVASHRHK